MLELINTSQDLEDILKALVAAKIVTLAVADEVRCEQRALPTAFGESMASRATNNWDDLPSLSRARESQALSNEAGCTPADYAAAFLKNKQ